MINRLIEPTSGTISLDGESTADMDPALLRRRIGYVIQHAGLFPHRTIVDNVATRTFLPTICRHDPTFTEYPNAVHTLEFESDRRRYISDMLNWLNANSL